MDNEPTGTDTDESYDVVVVGDAATPYAGVIASAADGMTAGTLLDHELVVVDRAEVVATHRNLWTDTKDAAHAAHGKNRKQHRKEAA
jgi:hypothetical protein